MACKINPKYQTPRGYRWGNEMILPYESLWGIINFFQYLNRLRKSDIVGSRHSKKGLSITNAKSRLNDQYMVFDFSGSLLDDLYIPAGHFPGFDSVEACPNLFSRVFNIRTNVYYCPICMQKYAYHSYMHQICGIDKCFIHDIRLVSTRLPYALNTYKKDGPYQFGDVRYEERFEFADVISLVKDREGFRYDILIANPDKFSSFHLDSGRPINTDHIAWGKKPFAVVRDEDYIKKYLKENYFDPQKMTVFSDPEVFFIDERLKYLRSEYGTDTVNKVILEYDDFGPDDEFLDRVKPYDPKLVRDILLLMLLGGNSRRDWLLVYDKRTARVSDYYGTSLYMNFLLGFHSFMSVSSNEDDDYQKTEKLVFNEDQLEYKDNGLIYYFVHPAEMCAALLMTRAYIDDMEKVFPDARSCCRYMRMGVSRKPPPLLYKIIKKGAGVFELYRGKAQKPLQG